MNEEKASETDKNTQDGGKIKRRFRFNMADKKLAAVILIILVAIIAGCVYWFFIREKPIIVMLGDTEAKKYGNTIEIDGQKIDTKFYDSLNETELSEETKELYAKDIATYEKKTSGDNPKIEDLNILARLYAVAGEKDKAVKTYEIVKERADKDMENYDVFLQFIDEEIRRLKE